MATHKELITSGKFDEKFKRALLDYYNYGFKNLGSFEAKKRQTVSEDWLRLNRVISDYLEWSDDRNAVMFASADSQSMEENPFHRIYRFCKYKPLTYPAYFLHTMAALCSKFSLRDGLDSLDLDEEQRLHLEDVLESQSKLKTSDLIIFYTEALALTEGDDKNKTPNNRLDDLLLLGLVECEQYKSKGDRRWSLPEFTVGNILKTGLAVDKDFEHHLRSVLEFFSKYYLFGEVGTFLLDRIYDSEISPFRFKHEYFMQSLNDFNIVDLLYAIENGKWCKIKYSHGTAGFETELLCYPLEIRISNTQGREFLIYYEPFRRSFTALRIEFIDSIEYFEDKKVKSILIQEGYHTASESVDADIANAQKSIRYSWGVATTKKQEGNAINPIVPHSVSLQIAYNPNTDYYIVNRLNRERRFGSISDPDDNPYIRFSVDISDEVELRPWMRSFYSRIMSCDGMDTDTFSLDTDVENIVNLLLHDSLIPAHKRVNPPTFDRWDIPPKVKKELGNGTKARKHDLVFNEVFSIYYYVMADVFTQLCSGAIGESYTESEIDEIIVQSFNKYYLRIGEETEELLPSEIKELLLFGGFLKKTKRAVDGEYELVKNPSGNGFSRKAKEEPSFLPKYKCASGTEFYRDVVPLSTMEIRWLKTIIHDKDNRIKLFMSAPEIAVLEDLLKRYAPTLSPLPMEKIVFFDRFHFPENSPKHIASVLATLLEGIYDQKTVHIKYHTMKNRVKIGEFRPIVLEFSKRNNRFQGFFQECGSNIIYTMNVSRIETADETETSFDYAAAEQALHAFREENATSVTVEFYNVRNIVDRILTEFSPWKKLCSYDPESELYTLTVFYQKQDEVDLVVRLLGYGGNLRIVNKEHPICKEIQSRMNRQMELIRERRSSHSGRESSDNR